MQGSFEKAKSWVKELQRQASPNIVIALVGNKVDLLSEEGASATEGAQKQSEEGEEDEDDDDDENETVTGNNTGSAAAAASSKRAVPKEEAKAYADEGGLLFFETSAKTGEGIVELFTEIGTYPNLSPPDLKGD